MIETSPTIGKISAALLHVQGAITGVKKDSKNPAFKSSYASLEAVIDKARPALQAEGVVFLQGPGEVVDGNLSVSTMLIHAESQEWISSTIQIPLGKRDPQGAGSAITYASRYSLMAMLGIPPTDDDGEGAMERTAPAAPSAAPASKPPSKATMRPVDAEMRTEIDACATVDQLRALWRSPPFKTEFEKLPQDWKDALIEHFNERTADLTPKTNSMGFVTPDFDRLDGRQ